ncbi:MAG: hypothetical protein ACPGUD_02690 [Parashewanella sp.]
MKQLALTVFILISFCLQLVAQSAQATVAPVSMSSSHNSTSNDAPAMMEHCQHHLTSSAGEVRECCSQGDEQHQCSNECSQCVTSPAGASILCIASSLQLGVNGNQDNACLPQHFYSFLSNNLLRPPITK